ncbi:MAG: invasion associated locus B family protein [Gallionella sp.]|nr:invasion associated locus B family protein [Gallionella sp.]
MKKLSPLLFRSVIFAAFISPLAQTAQAEVKAGDRFGDWVFECAALAEDKTTCALTQTLQSKQGNQRIVKFNLARNEAKGRIQLTAVVPLGIHLPSGVSGAIDKNKPFQYTLQTCLQPGCIATYAVDGNFLKAMQAGQTLTIRFSGNGGKTPFSFDGSLKGLSEGMKAAKLNP